MLHINAPEEIYAPDAFPTDRRVALRLLWLLEDPRAELDEIARVVAADPGLSVRMLSLANSPFYGRTGGAKTVPRAVSLLGTQTVRSLAAPVALQLFTSHRAELPDHFWLHAITAAVAAARVAGHIKVDPAEALTATLLHDYGEQLMRDRDPQRFEEMVRAVSDDPVEVRLAIERKLFGIDHATLGAQTLSRQGLPLSITAAVRDHHVPSTRATPLARTMHVADCIAKVADGDSRLDLDTILCRGGVAAASDRLIDEVKTDRREVLRFLAYY